MANEQKPYAAFMLSFAGGVLVLANGLAFILASRGISRALEYVMNTSGLSLVAALAIQHILFSLSSVGLILGALMIIASLMLYYKPSSSGGWGASILVLSILSIFAGGGFMLGLILGAIGGSLAISWRPKCA